MTLAAIGKRAREVAVETYDLNIMKQKYVERYQVIASSIDTLPKYSLKRKIISNIKNAVKRAARIICGQAE